LPWLIRHLYSVFTPIYILYSSLIKNRTQVIKFTMMNW